MALGRLSGHHAVALCCVLQELQGEYSIGLVTVIATVAGATIAPGLLGVPVVDGCRRPDLMVKVERNEASSDGTWTIATGGTPVLVTSVSGGACTAFAAGSVVHWIAPPAGISESGVVATGGVSGGTDSGDFGALRQVRVFRDIGSSPKAQEFFRARMGTFPAVCIQWRSTTPADGSSGSAWGGGGKTRLARGVRLYVDNFDLAIVTTRLDCDDERTREGDALRDSMLELLHERQVWRGLELSRPEGIQVLEAKQTITTPSSYIDLIRVALQYSLTRTPGPVRSSPWERTRYVLARPNSLDVLEAMVDFVEPQSDQVDPVEPETPDSSTLHGFSTGWSLWWAN